MNVEGRLRIALTADSGRVTQARIDSSRPVHAANILRGREVAEALELLSMLFAICGTAQAAAGVKACEQALGVGVVQRTEELRQCLVRAETVREHLTRIFLDWPGISGSDPEPQSMAMIFKLLRAYRQAVTGGQNLFALTGVAQQPRLKTLNDLVSSVDEILEEAVFAMPPHSWLAIDTEDSLATWAAPGTTPAARLLGWVMRSGWSDLGSCEISEMPIMDNDLISQAMERATFIERPRWHGDCCETTSLCRTDSPLLQQMRTRYGNGLLVRLAARLTEIAQLSGKLLPSTDEFAEKRSSVVPKNPGLGEVEAARGHLVHRVQLEGERVVDYRILAPTEWNFHPGGVVARSLAKLYGNPEQMRKQAKLLIDAIDPCVAYDLIFI